jgi:8-oxo-dGTP pyrophosphatase MutT (NUDIX family)
MGDGDGWARCDLGHVHWGRYGAAGLLVFHREPDGEPYVLLQQRAWWCSGGGTWGMFGGGRHSGESPVTAALRETSEECTLDVTNLRVHGFTVDDHGGGWGFTTVVASLANRQDVGPASMETRDAAWVPAAQVTDLKLFPPFKATWPRLKPTMSRLVLVVDAANVMGSRPDGWWRDRAGAAERLRDQLAPLPGSGVTGLPKGVSSCDRCFPEVVLVVEGAASHITGTDEVRVVAAKGSADDAIVDLVAAAEPDTSYLVVTADRELRARCEAEGAFVTGPGWLLERLPPSS